MIQTGKLGTFRGVNQDTKEDEILREIIGENGEGIFGSLFGDIVEPLERVVKEKLPKLLSPEVTVSNVGNYIQQVIQEVEMILQPKLKKKYLKDNILPSITYRTYIYWIVEKLKSIGVNPEEYMSNFKDVPRIHGEDIFNILQDKALTTFFMVGKAIGILEFSENDINSYEEENEIKIPETTFEEIQVGLTSWQERDIKAKVPDTKKLHTIVHRDSEVIDDYYDDINLRLDRQDKAFKRSIRTRTRKFSNGNPDENFYTIKRKLPKEDIKKKAKARKCFEKEFAIPEFEQFQSYLGAIGLRNSRSKKKLRKSFSIEYYDEKLNKQVHAKLDIDKYDELPEFVEIECDDNDAIRSIIENLGLEGKQVLVGGSREIFKYHEKSEFYDKKYMVDEKTGEVRWNNGDIGNISDNPPLQN